MILTQHIIGDNIYKPKFIYPRVRGAIFIFDLQDHESFRILRDEIIPFILRAKSTTLKPLPAARMLGRPLLGFNSDPMAPKNVTQEEIDALIKDQHLVYSEIDINDPNFDGKIYGHFEQVLDDIFYDKLETIRKESRLFNGEDEKIERELEEERKKKEEEERKKREEEKRKNPEKYKTLFRN